MTDSQAEQAARFLALHQQRVSVGGRLRSLLSGRW
jgi:hypothetical protein